MPIFRCFPMRNIAFFAGGYRISNFALFLSIYGRLKLIRLKHMPIRA